MTGFLIKLVVCPSVVYLADLLFTQVNFTEPYQPLIVGLVLAIATHAMELALLRPGTVWLSTLVDFAAAAAIVFLGGYLLDARITVTGALLTAGMLAVTEYFQHIALNTSGKTVK